MTELHLALKDTSFNVTPEQLAAILSAIHPNAKYMRDYASGCYRVSGADLRGKAARYGAEYHRSRGRVHAIAASVLGESLISVTGYRSTKSVWSADALAQEMGV